MTQLFFIGCHDVEKILKIVDKNLLNSKVVLVNKIKINKILFYKLILENVFCTINYSGSIGLYLNNELKLV